MQSTLSEMEHVESGSKAVTGYVGEVLNHCVDRTVENLDGKLNYKGTVKKFRKNINSWILASMGGQNGLVQQISCSGIDTKILNFIDDYVDSYPEDVKEIIAQTESELGFSFANLGIGRDEYNKLSQSMRDGGLMHKDGAIKALTDIVVDRLDNIVMEIENKVPMQVNLRGASIELVDVLKGLDINVSGIQAAYKHDGLPGIREHLTDKVVLNGLPKVAPYLMLFEMQGYIKNLSVEHMTESYVNNGLISKGGLLDVITLNVLENFSAAGSLIEESLVKMAGNIYCQRLEMNSENQMHKVLWQMRARKILALSNTSNLLDNDRLANVVRDNGVYGKDGLVAYLANNCDNILDTCKYFSLFHQIEVDQVKDRLKNLSTLGMKKETKTILSKFQKYSMAVSRKAEGIGVTVDDFVRNAEYRKEKKQLFENNLGGIDQSAKVVAEGLGAMISLMNEYCDELDIENLDSDKLTNLIRTYAPKTKIVSNAVNMMAGKYIKRTIGKRISDYKLLTAGFLNELKIVVDEHFTNYQGIR